MVPYFMNAMKILVTVFLIWLRQLLHLIMVRSKVVQFIGTLWNLYLVVSPHQIMLQTNLGKIRQEDMEIIFQRSLPQLLLLRRMTINKPYSKLQQSSKEMILVFYNP